VLRRLGLDAVLRQLAGRTGERSELERQLDNAAATADIEQVRRLLERLVAERLADGRAGGNGAADGEPLPQQSGPTWPILPILRAGPDELAGLRAAVRPLARKLAPGSAGGAARPRRCRHAPHDPAQHELGRGAAQPGAAPPLPVPARPGGAVRRIGLGCPVRSVHAGSAARAARRAPSGPSWVFIDGIVEISDLLDRAPGVLDAHHLLCRRGLVSGDGRSDYARPGQLLARWRDVISAKTTVIVVGDAQPRPAPGGGRAGRAAPAVSAAVLAEPGAAGRVGHR
jgi:hypothetical protein